jgi:hypothetical protein
VRFMPKFMPKLEGSWRQKAEIWACFVRFCPCFVRGPAPYSACTRTHRVLSNHCCAGLQRTNHATTTNHSRSTSALGHRVHCVLYAIASSTSNAQLGRMQTRCRPRLYGRDSDKNRHSASITNSTVYQREATSDERAVCPPQRHMCTVHARVTATCNLARTLSQLSSQSRARNSTVYQRVATSDERAPWPTRRHMRTLHARA